MPSSHSSPFWIQPSAHTGTNGAEEREEDARETDEEERATDDGEDATMTTDEDWLDCANDADFDAGADDAPATTGTTDEAGVGDEGITTGGADETAGGTERALETGAATNEEDCWADEVESAMGAEEGGADDDTGDADAAEDFEAAQDTIFHLHVAPQTLPHAAADDADDPPGSHSSPTICDTMPSPQRTFVQDCVQFGPMPLRVLSSHSSPSLRMPLPQFDDVWARKFMPPTIATTAKSVMRAAAARRVSPGNRLRKRTAPSSGEERPCAIGWKPPFWWSRLRGHFSSPPVMRLTKIVCTLGPASNSPENILKMIQGGMNVARINFSHGDHETHGATIRSVKKVAEENGYDIPLMLDTKGPEIRTGDVTEPIAIKKGDEVLFTYEQDAKYEGTIVRVNYPEFAKDVEQAEAIIVDNGDMTFDFVKKHDAGVVLKANQDGSIGNRRHVNLPGANVSLPSITEKDWKDLEFGVQEKMDFIALSFVRCAKDIEEVREFLKKKNCDMQIISKIENRQSVENIGEIIDASDGIMVARGDLGSELPFQKIPAIQDMIVRMCRASGKHVIVATQMLESMIKNPMPTRAEVTDVAHAALTGTDTTMLSGESAAGKYPFASVAAMSSILEETEARMDAGDCCGSCDCGHAHDDNAVRAEAAVTMARSADAKAIVVICNTGRTAELASGYRPGVPVFAFSDSPALRRRLQIRFGLNPQAITMESDSELNIERALSTLEKKGLVAKDDRVVVVARQQVRSGPLVTVHLRKI